MNKIETSQLPGTFSQVLVTGFLVAGLQTQTVNQLDTTSNKASNMMLQSYYSKHKDSSTFDNHRSFITGEYEAVRENFENQIIQFYTNLLANQEQLGPEFEKVLNENMWDLYES